MPAYPNLIARIAGDGLIEETRDWANHFPWADRVEIPGWLRDGAKWDAYAEADIFVLPSYNEGLPMAVLEAMAAGCPTVTTPVGGTPEVMEEGIQGYLVPAGDAQALAQRIGELIDDPDLAYRMGTAGRKTVAEKFDIVAHVKRLASFYDQLLQGSDT